jgi:arginyl-tRNA synthetase
MPEMNLFDTYAQIVTAALGRLVASGSLPAGTDLSRVVVEPPRDATHGDMATNAAMVLAKGAGTNPRALAELIAAELRTEKGVVAVEIAGPGFINLRLDPAIWQDVLRAATLAGADFGRKVKVVGGTKTNVEYVSANPTGPMHVGHGRGAVFGDALANLLEFAGHDVTREYYINDAGAQVDVLARSAYLRYREALGEDIGAIPEGLYPGDYLVPVGQALARDFGDKFKDMTEADWLTTVRQYAVEAMLVMILHDLAALGVNFDVFFSEKSLVEGVQLYLGSNNQPPVFYFALKFYGFMNSLQNGVMSYLTNLESDLSEDEDHKPLSALSRSAEGRINQGNNLANILDQLRARDLIYEGRLPPPKGQVDEEWEDREQTLFRSSQFGDDSDRPVLKSDGGYTYFASDIAYHKSKFDRGFTQMIDIWGADHGGYVKRMQAAVTAITDGQATLDVKLCQLVKLLRNGEPVKMSKRSGDFVTLREVIDEVGRDAVRFMMIFRKNDATLDFDLAKVVEQSKDNPVFYVQYAHARCCSVEKQALEIYPDIDLSSAALAGADLTLLSDEAEASLIRLLAQYPRIIEQAAQAHEPHRVVFYAHDLASAFHSLWNRGKDLPDLRFVNQTDRLSTLARLALVRATRTTLASALAVAGVAAPEEMR